ncbi:MAG: hypothetical protein ABIY37_07565, partial [Devosia sp.]
RQLIATADAAAGEFLKATPIETRHDVQDEVSRRRQELVALVEAGRFSDVQKQASAHAQFYREEVKRLRVQAISAAERHRKVRRAVADAARSLAMSFATDQRDVPVALANVEREAIGASARRLQELQAIVDQSFRELASRPAAPSRADAGLAQRLATGSVPRTLAEWMAAQPAPPESRDRLDTVLAELEVLAPEEIFQQFGVRARGIADEAAERRALLEDSLIIDATQALQEVRASAAVSVRADEVVELLRAAGDGASATLRARIEAARSKPAALRSVVDEAVAFVDEHLKRLAADARRQAILRGLADLGYEVREGMATALAQDGRVVLARPGATDYGVEIGAPPDAGRLQVRVVGSDRPSTSRSVDRDRQAEEQWCGDVDRLTASLAKSGTSIAIEKAAAVGTVPLKSVPNIGRDGVDDTDRTRPQQKQLR